VNGSGAVALHYPINLPADYDMAIIRERIRTRGHALDDRKGLMLKAYCLREVGVDESRVNQYAPFYLWDSAAAAADFLWGGAGFGGIVDDFGRPTVLTWLPAAIAPGPAAKVEVSNAVLIRQPIPPGADVIEVARALRERVHSRSRDSRVHFALGAIDPTTWESVEFTTVAGAGYDQGSAPDRVDFTVVHVSQPTVH